MTLDYANYISLKVSEPVKNEKCILRKTILEKFFILQNKKVIIVNSMAGSGKTTLLSQISSYAQIKTSWYHLDDIDNELSLFLKYFIHSISCNVKEFKLDFLNCFNGELNSNQLCIFVLENVINQLEKKNKERLTVILDDFHKINNEHIVRFIELFIKYMPGNVVIIFSSRTKIKLNTSNCVSPSDIAMIEEEDLRFDKEEIQELIRLKGVGYLENQAADIEQKTEGWAMGVNFILNEIAACGVKQGNFPLIKHGSYIYENVFSEIFDGLTLAHQEFLKDTCYLEEINVKICDEIFERSDSADILSELEEKSFCILRVGRQDNFFKYHNMFKGFLQMKYADEKKDILNRLGRGFYLKKQYEQAIEYFILAENTEQVEMVLELFASNALALIDLSIQEKWINYIVAKKEITSRWIMLMYGCLSSYRGEFTKAEELINSAEKFLGKDSNMDAVLYIGLHKSRIYRNKGLIDKSIKTSKSLLKTLKMQQLGLKYPIITELVYSLTVKGDFAASEELINQTIQSAKRQKLEWIEEELKRYLITVYTLMGEYNKAMLCYEECNISDMKFPEKFSVKTYIGSIFLTRCEIDLAYSMLTIDIEAKINFQYHEDMWLSYYYLSYVFFMRGDKEKAYFYLKKAEEKSYDGDEGNPLYFLFVKISKAMMYSFAGNINDGLEIISSCLENIHNESPYILCFVKTYAALIYLKAGEYDKSHVFAVNAGEIASKIKMKWLYFMTRGVLCHIEYKRGDIKKALEYAKVCLLIGADEKYINPFVLSGEMLTSCFLGIEYEIEYDYIKEIFSKVHNKPVNSLLKLLQKNDSRLSTRVFEILDIMGYPTFCDRLQIALNQPFEGVKNLFLANMQTEESINRNVNIYVCCFGGLSAYTADKKVRLVEWRTKKTKELFAYLIHNMGRYVSKNELQLALWPDLPENRASALVYTSLYYIRKAFSSIAEDIIINFNGGYMLNAEYIISDIGCFKDILKNVSEKKEDINAFEKIIALYKEPYLYENEYLWSIVDCEHYESEYIKLLELIGSSYFNEAQYDKASLYFKKIIEKDPLKEEIYALLIKAQALSGNRKAVLDVYKKLSKVLDEELGIKPKAITRKIYYEMLSL